METFFEAISNYGFPVVLAGYLLMRFEKKIDKLERSINGRSGLIQVIEELKTLIEQKL